MTDPTPARAPHGVGFVDKVGIECLCGYTIGFDSGVGGWLAFNAHLARADEAAALRVEVERLRAVADIMRRHSHTSDGAVVSRMAGADPERDCHLCRALVAAGVLTLDGIGAGTRAAIAAPEPAAVSDVRAYNAQRERFLGWAEDPDLSSIVRDMASKASIPAEDAARHIESVLSDHAPEPAAAPTPERCAVTGCSHPDNERVHGYADGAMHPFQPAPAADAGRTHHVGDDCPGGHR